MSLHGKPVIETTHLPDGRNAHIRVGIAEDSYVADRELNTVVSRCASVTAWRR